jgi:hypothetical protein
VLQAGEADVLYIDRSADGGVFRSRLQDPVDCHRLHASKAILRATRETGGRSFILLPTGSRPRRGATILCLYLYCDIRCKAESVGFGG